MATEETLAASLRTNWPYALALIPILTSWLCDRQVPADLRSTIADGVSGLLTLLLVTIIQRQRRALEGISITDKLTGLFNSRFLRVELDRQVYMAHRTGLPLSLIFLDVDNLKAVNDRRGHVFGNGILRRLGQCLTGAIRHQMDLCFRFGGDEFLVLCPHADLAAAHEIAKRVFDIPNSIKQFADARITLSLGVIQLRGGESAGDFLKRADRTMYSVKLGGKNGIGFDSNGASRRAVSASF